MVGNAAEEGLMQQVGNPSHLDTGRIVVPAAALTGCGAGYLVWRLIPVVTVWTALIVGVVIAGLVAWRLAIWFANRAESRTSQMREAKRAAEVAETNRQLAAIHKPEGTA